MPLLRISNIDVRRWAFTAAFLSALCSLCLCSLLLLSGCKRAESIVAGLLKKKQDTNIGEGDALARLGNPSTRAQAARELGEGKVKGVLEALKGYLQDKDPNVRLNCAWAVGEIGEPNAIGDVRVLLTDHEANVRLAAAEALGKMPGRESVLWLGQALAGDADKRVRMAAARSLGAVPHAESAVWLTKALGESEADADVVSAAGESLAKVGLPACGAVCAAMPVLTPRGRLLAVQAVAGLKDPNAVASLVVAVEYSCVGRGGATDVKTCALAVDALAAQGPAAVPVLARQAVHVANKPALKEEAAKVFRRIGRPAIPPLVDRIMTWQPFPDLGELKLWAGVLEEIGRDDAQAQKALAVAKPQLK
jgi:HEAT repeat protein